jgi:2-oxoglutarate ferredoxin oxidoreductase subunit beta
VLKDQRPQVVDIGNPGVSANDLWIHDEGDIFKASVLTRFFDDPSQAGSLPRPFGVLYAVDRPCYESLLFDQIAEVTEKKGIGDLDKLIAGSRTWEIQ